MSTKDRYKLELEQLLDGGHSLSDILEMLAEVCWEKSDYVQATYPDDKALIKLWQKRGDSLNVQSCRNLFEGE